MARKKLLNEGEVRQFMKLANLGALSENYFTNNPLEEESEEEEIHDLEGDLGHEDHLADEEGDELDAMDLEGGGDNEALLARVVQAVADELGVEVDVEGAEEGGEELEIDAELEEPLPGGEELEMGAEEEVELPGGRDKMYQEAQGADARRAKGESGDPVATQESQQLNELGPEAAEVAMQVAQMMGDPTALSAAVAASPLLAPLLNKISQVMGDRKVQAAVQAAGAGEEDVAAQPGALGEEEIVAEVARRVAARLQTQKRQEEVSTQLAERIFDRLTSK